MPAYLIVFREEPVRWCESPGYQAPRPHRKQAAEVRALIVEGL